jgi:nucleotide-binding universal stress UspA family protein
MLGPAMPQKTLLFGTDLGEGAAATVDCAAAFARAAGYELALVCAYGGESEAPSQSPGEAALRERLHHEGDRLRKLLDAEAARLTAAGTVVRSARLREGRPFEALLAEAAALDAGAIAIGPHTRWAGVLDRLFGSTALRVIREASCPVLVLPSPPRSIELRGTTIFVGLGGVPVDLRAIDAAIDLATATGAKACALHVLTGDGTGDRATAPAADHVAALPETRRLTKIVCLDPAGRDPVDTFLAAAEDEGAALLVLGAKSLPIGARLLSPTFVERACRHATVPVLVVP